MSYDSARCGRKTLLLWKKDRKPRLAFLKTSDLAGKSFPCMVNYGVWTAISYDDLVSIEDAFFFSSAQGPS